MNVVPCVGEVCVTLLVRGLIQRHHGHAGPRNQDQANDHVVGMRDLDAGAPLEQSLGAHWVRLESVPRNALAGLIRVERDADIDTIALGFYWTRPAEGSHPWALACRECSAPNRWGQGST